MWPVRVHEMYFPGFVEENWGGGGEDHLEDLGVDGRIMLNIP